MSSMVRGARALGLGLVAAAALGATSANAYQVVSRFPQPQQIGHDGRLAVEASVISVINCTAGERAGQFWIYQYVNRAGYRAILPPHWANALGGRDWPTFQEAATMACSGVAVAPAATSYGHTAAKPPVNRISTRKSLHPVGSPSRGGAMAMGGGEGHHHN